MLGDDLKKSLEPIQVSDELLEKTRKAIEQARLQQASESLAPAKRSSRIPFAVKALVPVACTVLIVGGLILALPKLLSSPKQDKTKGSVKVHNVAIEKDVADEIEKVVDSDAGADYYSDDSMESEVYDKGPEIDGSPSFLVNPTSHLGYGEDGDGLSVRVGTYMLCISADQRSLVLLYASSMTPVTDDPDHEAPLLPSSFTDSDMILTKLEYDEESGTLRIYASTDPRETHGTYQTYVCTYIDGQLYGPGPESEDWGFWG